MKSEKEKMLAGELYFADDPQLLEERQRSRRLTRAYNETLGERSESRFALLRELLGSTGPSIEIEPPFYCDYGSNIFVGDKFFANFNCIILDVATVIIGSNVFFGPNVQIYTPTHPILAAERNKRLEAGKPIVIEDDVWLGGGVIVNPGITIGRGTTIGAGSVVTKNVPPEVFAAGNPCRVIRELKT